MGLFFRKSKKIAPGVRLNLSKRGAGLSAGVRGARVSANTQGETYVSGGRGGLYFRRRLKKGKGAGPELSPEKEERARNLEFGHFLVEKAQSQGLTEVSDEMIAEAAEEFFGDTSCPVARSAIAYVNQMG